MDIKINIVEVASELADRDLVIRYGGVGGRSLFPNGILIELEDELSYTEEAQDYFNTKYDFWYDFLWNLKTEN